MKLNQFLAQATGISRRHASEELKAGKVRINGRSAEFWEEVDPRKDCVQYKGQVLNILENITTIILNKPVGYITTRRDRQGRKTVMDLLPQELQGLKPAGRLDADSEGLLILSNDGDYIYELTHPKFEHEKEYIMELKKNIDEKLLRSFTRGISLQEGIAKADVLEQVAPRTLRVIIHQGWKRQLRRMAEACGNKVVSLKRVRMGDIALGSLKEGSWKKICRT